MTTKIKMPSVGQTTDEAMIAVWLKKVGDPVAKGDVLFEVETDKATLAVESYADGILLAVYFDEGAYASTGDVVALIGKPEEAVSMDSGKPLPMKTHDAIEHLRSEDEYQPIMKEKQGASANALSSAGFPTGAVSKEAISGEAVSTGKIPASPKARITSKEHAVKLEAVSHVFPGEILKHHHVLTYLKQQTSSEQMKSEEQLRLERQETTPAHTEDEDKPLSPMRRTIARRMMESVQLTPQFQISTNIDMTELIHLRQKLNERLMNEAVKISYNDLLIYFISRVLLKHPLIHATYMEDRIRYHRHIHFGLAVGLNEGLLVPVVREADRKTLKEIARENADNIALAKEGRISTEALSGGMITLSNLGSYGISEFKAILNYPESAILAVGAIIEKPVVIHGAVVVRAIMSLTATFDHRIIDGATGAAFLEELKEVLEAPQFILVY